MVYEHLPEYLKSDLKAGWLESSLINLTADELIEAYTSHIEEMVDEGMMERKDGKSKIKDFKKTIKKVTE